ncbi:MAG: hypothetical protein WD058_04120 [Dehalococcoidia bacterium]
MRAHGALAVALVAAYCIACSPEPAPEVIDVEAMRASGASDEVIEGCRTLVAETDRAHAALAEAPDEHGVRRYLERMDRVLSDLEFNGVTEEAFVRSILGRRANVLRFRVLLDAVPFEDVQGAIVSSTGRYGDFAPDEYYVQVARDQPESLTDTLRFMVHAPICLPATDA